MAKPKKTDPMTDDLDLENLDANSLNDDDELISLPVATPQAAVGTSVMDFSDFEKGIEEITLDTESEMKVLIYGPNGTGKTYMTGTFPGPILVLDINEKGTKSLIGTGAKKRQIQTFEMFQMAYWYLKSGNHPYKTVVLDNVTTLQEMAMRFVMGKEAEVDVSKDMDLPTKHDWGGLSQIMKRWLIDFRNLPMNVVFIAQEKRSSDDDIDSDQVSVFPQVSSSVRAILGAAVDVIGNTYIKEVDDPNNPGNVIVKYCMRIAANQKYMAKCRVPRGAKCPISIVNPSYQSLKKIMNGEYGKKAEQKGVTNNGKD